MSDETVNQKLRSMAEHRGLRLLRSRKRKPGSGDYGKFGLADANGRALLGMSKDGLTASPEDIEAYLREGAASTWEASAKVTPARSSLTKSRARSREEIATLVIRPRAKPAVRSRKSPRSADTGAVSSEGRAPRPQARDVNVDDAGRRPTRSMGSKGRVEGPVREEKSVASGRTSPIICTARPGDASEVAILLRQLRATKIDELSVTRNMEAVREAGGGAVIARQGKLIGCCSWAMLATFQHGLIGRITLLVVDMRHRRQGVATAMLEQAYTALEKAGCTRIEAMSDIEIDNAHNFFRALKFEQTSYRFAKVMRSSK